MKKTTQLLLLAVLFAAKAPAQTDSLFRDGQWWYTFDAPTAATKYFRPQKQFSAIFISDSAMITTAWVTNVPYDVAHDPLCKLLSGCTGTMLLNGKKYDFQMFTFSSSLLFVASYPFWGTQKIIAKNQKIFINGIQQGSYK